MTAPGTHVPVRTRGSNIARVGWETAEHTPIEHAARRKKKTRTNSACIASKHVSRKRSETPRLQQHPCSTYCRYQYTAVCTSPRCVAGTVPCVVSTALSSTRTPSSTWAGVKNLSRASC